MWLVVIICKSASVSNACNVNWNGNASNNNASNALRVCPIFRDGFISSLALASTLSLFKRGDYEPVSNEQNRLSDVS